MTKQVWFIKKILIPCMIIILVVILLWYPYNSPRHSLWDTFFPDRAKESRRAVSPATDSLASDIKFNAEYDHELPPDTVSELIDWMLSKHPDAEYYFEDRPYHIDFEKKEITGAYKEKIDYYKTDDGKYVLLSYGLNNVCENGKGDDYLLTFEVKLDGKQDK